MIIIMARLWCDYFIAEARNAKTLMVYPHTPAHWLFACDVYKYIHFVCVCGARPPLMHEESEMDFFTLGKTKKHIKRKFTAGRAAPL
jgi:hypothetical protein